MTLFRRPSEPTSSFPEVLGYASTLGITPSQDELGLPISQLRCSAVPKHRLFSVPCRDLSLIAHFRKSQHCWRMALASRLAKVAFRTEEILCETLSTKMQQSQIILRARMTFLGRL